MFKNHPPELFITKTSISPLMPSVAVMAALKLTSLGTTCQRSKDCSMARASCHRTPGIDFSTTLKKKVIKHPLQPDMANFDAIWMPMFVAKKPTHDSKSNEESELRQKPCQLVRSNPTGGFNLSAPKNRFIFRAAASLNVLNESCSPWASALTVALNAKTSGEEFGACDCLKSQAILDALTPTLTHPRTLAYNLYFLKRSATLGIQTSSNMLSSWDAPHLT